MANDVHWCIENKKVLTFESFADHFGLTDSESAYNRYAKILRSHLKNKELEDDFDLWKASDAADDYWTTKNRNVTIRRSTRKATKHVQKSILREFDELEKIFSEFDTN